MKKVKRFQEGGFNPSMSSDVYERVRKAMRERGLEASGVEEAAQAARSREQADPLANLITESLARDKRQQEKLAQERRRPSPAAEAVIKEGQRLDDERSSMKFANEMGLDFPASFRTREMGTRDRPEYPEFEGPRGRAPLEERVSRGREPGLEGVYPELAALGRGAGIVGTAVKQGINRLSRRDDVEGEAAKVFTRPVPREMRESEALKRARTAAERRKAAEEAKSTRDTDRMAGESLGPVKPRGMAPRREPPAPRDADEARMAGEGFGFKRGGKTKFSSGGSVSSRADGIAKRGKNKGRII